MIFLISILFNAAPITDEYKKGPMEGRALYLDAQATTPMVSSRCDVIRCNPFMHTNNVQDD